MIIREDENKVLVSAATLTLDHRDDYSVRVNATGMDPQGNVVTLQVALSYNEIQFLMRAMTMDNPD